MNDLPVGTHCPLCRAPTKTVSAAGRYATCFNGHEVNVVSLLFGILPLIPGWICWHTRSNSGVSKARYAFLGVEATAFLKTEGDEEIGQFLISKYEDWMEHAHHGTTIEWELDCAVPETTLLKELRAAERSLTVAQQTLAELGRQLQEYYP